ncbi:MAG: 4Fe-4S dicluster domain-containing protein [Raoultibacter sp.]
MKRRDFLIAGAVFGVASLGCLEGCSPVEAASCDSSGGVEGKHWGFVIDVDKFNKDADVQKMALACHRAHNVPNIDNPKEEIKWIWEEDFESTFADMDAKYLSGEIKELSVPVLCNHCEEPPCVRVCPTKATFKRKDGIVEMDYHRCIGCRFCMAGCPYGARSLNFRNPAPYIKEVDPTYPTRTRGVVEKCMMCADRIDKGELPLCVEASNGSMLFGDLNDPNSEVRRALAHAFSIQRRQTLGTGPSIYYILKEGEARA